MTITATSFATLLSSSGLGTSDEVASAAINTLFNGSGVSNVVFSGSTSAAYVVESFSINNVFSKTGGIFLSSGGLPGNSNTKTSYSVTNGTAGDDDLTAVAKAAFAGAGQTRDAVTLSFDYTNTNPNINTLQFSFVFGSDEFPEYANSSYVDVAAVFVNGSNQALFNNAADQPLSVTKKNLDLGNFIDNTKGGYDIEWDGFSTILTIRAAITLGVNQIKIGIADTGDSIYDSGLYITGIKLSNDGGTGGGTLVVVDAPAGGGEVAASIAPEEINLGTGKYSIAGAASDLNGDVLTNFGKDDKLIVKDATFSKKNVVVTYGSLILNIDTNGDGSSDTKVTFAGNFAGKTVGVVNNGGNTELSILDTKPTNGDDELTGTNGADTIKGLGGNDTIKGKGGNDTLEGQAGHDSVYGEAGNDTLKGGSGNDKLYGGSGNDKLYGGLGNDTLEGGSGDDQLYGEAGKDTLKGGSGNDKLYGGSGNDKLYGGQNNDTLEGGTGDDQLYGEAGTDTLKGGAGNDTLNGGAGNDKLYGGTGNDKLTGGAGKDTFYFLDDFKGKDTITDFQAGKSKVDVIVFKKNIFDSFDDVIAHATDTSKGLTISYEDAKITLLGVKVADLHTNDFLFA